MSNHMLMPRNKIDDLFAEVEKLTQEFSGAPRLGQQDVCNAINKLATAQHAAFDFLAAKLEALKTK